MRQLLVLVLAVMPLAAAGEVYRTVDENGNVRYSDTPPHAEAAPMKVRKAQGYAFDSSAVGVSGDGDDAGEDEASGEPLKVRVTSPEAGSTIRDPQPTLTVAAAATPKLPEGAGYVFVHNGKVVNSTPSAAASITVNEVWRGDHSFAVRVVDAGGKVLGQSESVTVYKRPPTAIKR